MSQKLKPGHKFPDIQISKLGNGTVNLGVPHKDDTQWQMVLVYRGKHCPICTKYLKQVEKKKEEFYKIGVDILAISCDPEEKAKEHVEDMGISFDVGYGLGLEDARTLGLYISEPRSPKETDRPFTEPGVLVVNGDGNLHVIDLANNPFVRPDLDLLLDGLKFIKNPENNYPIRGTKE